MLRTGLGNPHLARMTEETDKSMKKDSVQEKKKAQSGKSFTHNYKKAFENLYF